MNVFIYSLITFHMQRFAVFKTLIYKCFKNLTLKTETTKATIQQIKHFVFSFKLT